MILDIPLADEDQSHIRRQVKDVLGVDCSNVAMPSGSITSENRHLERQFYSDLRSGRLQHPVVSYQLQVKSHVIPLVLATAILSPLVHESSAASQPGT